MTAPRYAATLKSIIRNQKGRTLFEAVVVAALVGFFIFIAFDRYISTIKPVQETALTIELSNLRRAVNFYVMLNSSLPLSLKDLLNKKAAVAKSDIEGKEYKIEIVGNYVESMTTDVVGYPLDPFGGRYNYDPKTGRVWSSTKGYEKW
ncbi:hypothetical protein EPN18_08625 [bacterium]|nr:MAG: hypothetical protein EPN18_08625 [bacterium]